jgi:hypothetical protein
MQKAVAFFLLILIGMNGLLYAQEEDIDIWDVYAPDMFGRGDQIFVISLGTIFPVLFINTYDWSRIRDHGVSPVGGTGSLSYNFFLGRNIFIGGEIGGSFIGTRGGNMLYMIPLGFRFGYQFSHWRFEFPLTLAVGMAWQRFLNQGYYGLYAKIGAAVFYRFSTDWSFGIQSNWYWFPQWTDVPSRNIDGNFVNLTLSARYHF